ncbi:CopG family ribbon-helix-helix protein [Inquilinus sp. YAF38]|uniref:CopG family ribbon-helix-helix protein n=1 Tax=Inquilinus sp. YAF38 TaxID=3233084 RepID=UPI003F92AAD7
MAASATVTIRLDAEVSEKLGRIARETGRSRSRLAAQAVAVFVDRELQVVDGIRRGLADMKAGRVVPHEEVMAEGRAIIAAAKDRQNRRRG